MIKNDYSKKMAEEFTSLIKKIEKLNKNNENPFTEIDSAYKKFLGISSGFANNISTIDLIKLLRTNMVPDGNKLTIAAKLLLEEGKICEKSNDIENAFYKYEKAFSLIYVVFYNNFECILNEYEQIAGEITSLLNEYELDERTTFKVFNYYSITGNYGKADEYVFELINNFSNKDKYKNEAINFYNNLLSKNDDELEKGNLSREEAKEALKEVENI
ncbi:DUF6483 family protein [Clostridium guangxiense]|uniref:DUF6483 family protein n=1 Tax=Clostridium guangxiense TaxID=1662055 RepID=UPI001E2D0C10|nr:DUF6483 family protein [Clostridium guangxiense]MCD2348807.1 DUF6483 family protein [Clostridium guangxiense]